MGSGFIPYFRFLFLRSDMFSLQATEAQSRIHLEAIKKFGIKRQVRKAKEELFELILAIRAHEDGEVSEDDVRDEIADVFIMIQQLAAIYGTAKISLRIDIKTDLLQGRIFYNEP